ncbi:MAG: dethiobiotin synthase [Alphaproteobacteria bacterium]|nr:dethiobiotin synthase [Alphaproteobacteria bacterium]
MMNRIVITGTDTEIGKTTFSAALMLGLEKAGLKPHYWKPIQSGITDGVDTRSVQRLSGLPDDRFMAERYIFSQSLSPHRAAELDGQSVDMKALCNLENIPACDDGTLIIEGAGGLMVPLTRKNLQINLYKEWQIPVILCARTGLGTINHTLLSLEALWSRKIPVRGLVFIGEENPDNVETIAAFSKTEILGVMPKLDRLDPKTLVDIFATNFNIQDFVS